MKQLLIIFFISMVSCQVFFQTAILNSNEKPSIIMDSETKIIEGDLYFRLIDFQMFYYDLPDSVMANMVSDLKIKNTNTLNTQDKLVYSWFKFVAENDLMRKPFVRLRKDDGEIIIIFLDAMDYDMLKKYSYSDLVENNKKIRIKAEVVDLKHDTIKVYSVISPITMSKVVGKTYWKK